MSKSFGNIDVRTGIATRLKAERERIGRSQADFGRALDVTRQSIVNYENGVSPVPAEVVAQAAALGVDVVFVMTGQATKPPPSGSRNVVAGTGNLVASDYAQIHQNISPRIVHKAEVKPGVEHVSHAQKANLKRLVDEIVELESQVKRAPKGYAAVWSALNRYSRVTKYDFIVAADYDRAEKYLRQWIGRLNGMAGAPMKNPRWRSGRYAYIKINTMDDPAWLVAQLREKFGVSSLVELDEQGLERMYRVVAARKRK